MAVLNYVVRKATGEFFVGCGYAGPGNSVPYFHEKLDDAVKLYKTEKRAWDAAEKWGCTVAVVDVSSDMVPRLVVPAEDPETMTGSSVGTAGKFKQAMDHDAGIDRETAAGVADLAEMAVEIVEAVEPETAAGSSAGTAGGLMAVRADPGPAAEAVIPGWKKPKKRWRERMAEKRQR